MAAVGYEFLRESLGLSAFPVARPALLKPVTRVEYVGYRMAEQALEVELRRETEFLAAYDAIYKAADARFDVRGDSLATLVRRCLDQNGLISNNRRKQFATSVPNELFDFLEAAAAEYQQARGADAASPAAKP